MPTKTSTPCRNKACNHTTKDASGYCLVCRPIYYKPYKQYDKTRPTSRERGYTNTWDKARRIQLREHPICTCGQRAVLVHHIIEIDKGGELLDQDNLLSMCRDCHERLHGRKV